MIKITRTQDCIYRETYVLNLDDEYVASVANYFHRMTEQKYLGQIEITAELLARAFEYQLTPEQNIEIEMHGHTYHLQNLLIDIINDDIWSCDYESEYLDYYDVYNDKVEY